MNGKDIYVLRKTVTHFRLKKPIIHEVQIGGKIDNIVERMHVTGKQKYELRKLRKTEFDDQLGGTITLELLTPQQAMASLKTKRTFADRIDSFFSKARSVCRFS